MAGIIKTEAMVGLRKNSELFLSMSSFLDAGFDVTWCNERLLGGTRVTVVFLKPNDEIKRDYGFEYEVSLYYSSYSQLESRSIRIIDHVMSSDPAKGRVESMWCFYISKSNDAVSWISSYLVEQRESRIIVPFSLHEVKDKKDKWIVINRMRENFISIDRFKHTLPLEEDTYFFGRSREVSKIVESIRKTENIGIFGLRKTGKTSIIYKLKRMYNENTDVLFVTLDAQSPSIRKKHWNELLNYIISQVKFECKCDINEYNFSEANAADSFEIALDQVFNKSQIKKIVLCIDEIEWISPNTCKDVHWNSEYSDFWQVFRSYQTKRRKICVILAGVNPSITEIDRYDLHQNPLFGIVTPIFLKGLSESELKDMLQKIGKIMGVTFAANADTYLYEQYSGHPLLTRLSASIAIELIRNKDKKFPLVITNHNLINESTLRESELQFYVKHVVAELEQFYPLEYELLEKIAIDDIDGYRQKIVQGWDNSHLVRYGIIQTGDFPFITYNVVKDFLAIENARKNGRNTKYLVVEKENRETYIKIRTKNIIEDMRNLERLIRIKRTSLLFGPNSFPEAEKLLGLVIVNSIQELDANLNILNRCFVEAIENYGSSISNDKYFWNIIARDYPVLHEALARIKVYRHNSFHLVLTPTVEKRLKEYLEKDLFGIYEAEESIKSWILFQRTFDELIRGINHEIAKLEME